MRKPTLFFLLFFCFEFTTFAQIDLEGFLVSDSSMSWFNSKIDPLNKNITDGQYTELERKARNSHPYLIQGNWTSGNILFKNKWYAGQQLIYDIEKQILYIGVIDEGKWKTQPILINQTYIEKFSIYDKNFKYITTPEILIPSGFFEIIYEGAQISMYSKRKKSLRIYSGNSSYIEEDKYYLLKDDKYYIYSRRPSLLRLYPDHKKEIRKFIRANKINAQKGNDLYLARIIEFCNSLN